MRYLIFLSIVILLGLAGCTDLQDPVSTTAADENAEADAQRLVRSGPFRGTIDGTAITIGDCGQYTLLIAVDGSGPLSYLGLTDFSAEICSAWMDNIPPFEGEMTGTATGVAANGDTITMTMEGTYYAQDPPPTILQFDGTYTITGGTGRFAGASGTGSIYGEEDLQDLQGVHECWFRFDGSLQY